MTTNDRGPSRVPFFLAGAAAFAVPTLLVLLFAPFVWRQERLPTTPSGVLAFREVRNTSVVPANRADWKRQAYQTKQYAKLKSGEVVVPIIQVKRGRLTGILGGLRYEPTWEATNHRLNQWAPLLEMPIHADIVEYIVAIRSIPSGKGEETPWHIWNLHPAQTSGTLTLPEINQLDRFDRRPDRIGLEQAEEAARQRVAQLER